MESQEPVVSSTAPARGRVPHPGWLLVGVLAFATVATALRIGIPYERTQSAIRRIHSLGGRVQIREGTPHPVVHFLSELLDTSTGSLFDEVVKVDLSDTDATDDDLEVLYRLPSLQVLTLLGKVDVSDEAVARLQQALPSLVIQRPGNALLGIGAAPLYGATGCRVDLVMPHSAAERAGIRPGDLLLSIDGKRVPDFYELVALIGARKPGDSVRMELLRDGHSIALDVRLGAWD